MYEFPITAGEMRPARETCEKCHFPEKFSDDSFRQVAHYGDDKDNTPSTILLFLKTGGGSKRQGLGRGIHWHVENRVLYYPTDRQEQTIPYVRVYNDDGSVDEFVDLESAIAALQDIYRQTVFLEQKSDWTTHPNNVGHKDFPGCFRCHDGKHLNADGEAIRLECNICHSIPVVVGPQDFVTNIEISRGPEPESHKNPNWIAGHRTHLGPTCALCHTTSNPGGTDNTSFCSNSACHGSVWTYAGLDAPGLTEIVAAQLPTPTPAPTPAPVVGAPTYAANIQPLFEAWCGACHGEGDAAGLKLLTYADVMAGSSSGPVVVVGDAERSPLVEVQSGEHFGQLSSKELELVKQWIASGAPEQ